MNLGDYIWDRTTGYGKVRDEVLANPGVASFEQWVSGELKAAGDMDEPGTLDEWESLFGEYRREILALES